MGAPNRGNANTTNGGKKNGSKRRKSPIRSNLSATAGQLPGTLVHTGQKSVSTVSVSLIAYDSTSFREAVLKTEDDFTSLRDSKEKVVWIDVDAIHDVELLSRIGAAFKLHPLTLEDILSTEQRPKLEIHDDYAYVVMKMLWYNAEAGISTPADTSTANSEVSTEQISIIFGKNFVISFEERGLDVFDPIRDRIRKNLGRLRASGTDFLVYSLLDAVVDSYFVMLESFGEHVEELEEKVMGVPDQQTLRQIHDRRRDMIVLRKAVWPIREVISSFERDLPSLVADSTGVYLRDLYDHIVEVVDTIETLRDMLAVVLDMYLSSISNRLNSVMKVLTVISTIFMPLTFATGIYGMNFTQMPGLSSPYGFFTILFVMGVIVLSMLYLFRRRGWF